MSNEHAARPRPERLERKLTAILHADVQGYSRLLGEDEVTTLRTVASHLALMRSLVEQHGGRAVGSRGDSLLAEFPSVVDAVQCAVEMQQALKERNVEVPLARRVEFRIGINLGEVVVEGDEIYGEGINVAVRLEGLADAGGICLSEMVYQQLKNKLALSYEDLGPHTLKNIAEPVRVWRVVMDDAAALARQGRASPAQPIPYRGRRARRLGPRTILAGVVLLVGLLGTVWSLRHSHLNSQASALQTPAQPALALPDKPSLVVLPLVNMSHDPEQEYFSDGLTEDLTTALAKISALFVIARNSAFTYKGKPVDVKAVSRELGVRYVVEGSVQRADNRVRITAQLVDGLSAAHVWAESYDRELKDIFAVQDEITQQIVATLKAEVLAAEQKRIRRIPTTNLTAYETLLRGQADFSRFTKEANAQARHMAERAVELDPTYAAAYTTLGWTYFLDWSLQWSQDPRVLERALECAHQALGLDDSLPGVHLLLGYLYLWKNRQHEQAIAEAEQAIALNPNGAEGYAALANILTFAGRPQEALALLEKGMRLNPRGPNSVAYLFELGHAYHWLRQYEQAIAMQHKVLTLNPRHFVAHLELAVMDQELGRAAEARAEVAAALELNPHYSLEDVKERHPYKDPATLERTLAALRQAGLK
jgi:adenylate cyclase